MSLIMLSTLIANETGVQVDDDAVWADIEQAAKQAKNSGSLWVTSKVSENTQWAYHISKQPVFDKKGAIYAIDVTLLEIAITPLNTASPFFSDTHPVGAPIHIKP